MRAALKISVVLLLLLSLVALLFLPSGSERAAALPRAKEATLPLPHATSAAAMALLDPSDGTLLAGSNADARLPMASTTKIMTALVVLERALPDATVTVPREAVGVEGSSIYLFEGEELTVRTLLYALMLSSANDAAVALALHVAGSIPAFAELMNGKALSLGLTDTHFENPHGLPAENHYTTARELALITAAAMKNPAFAEIVATKRYSVPQNGTGATRLFLNHNRLLSSCEGVIGVKTGFTRASGRCLVSAALREGLTLIAVTLNDPNDWHDHRALYDFGFGAYEAFTTAREGVTLPVVNGTVGSALLLPQYQRSFTLPRTHPDISLVIEAPRFLFGGIEKGAVCGYAVYYMGEEVIAKIPLAAAEQIPPASTKKPLFARFKARFGH